MMDHLSLYKGFGSFLILAFTSSSARCSTTRVILAMTFSLSLMCYPVQENHITGGKLVLQDPHHARTAPVSQTGIARCGHRSRRRVRSAVSGTGWQHATAGSMQ